MPFPLPPPGANAFKAGFLSLGYASDVIDQVNKPWNVVVGPGRGHALVIQTALINTIDLTNFRIPDTDYPARVTNASTVTQTKLKASLRTTLIRTSLRQTDLVTIAGLGVSKVVTANQSLYIRYDVSAATASIESGVWSQYPSPVGWVNAGAENLVQKYAYMSLACVKTHDKTKFADMVIQATGSDKNPLFDVYQLVRGGLALRADCVSGANVVLIQPWAAGY